MKRSVVYAQIFKTLCLVKSAASPPRCSVFLPVGMSLETKVAELPIREHDVGSEKVGIRVCLGASDAVPNHAGE